MLIGIEVGDGELHELQDNIFQSSFAFELTFNILPTLSSTVAHEVQQFYVVVEPPIRFGIAAALFAVV
jgi:hypothetical protein